MINFKVLCTLLSRKLKNFPKYLHQKSKFKLLFDNYKIRKRIIRLPIAKIRCQEKPFSELLGFSGKPIEYFPPYKFYKVAMTDQEIAYTYFFDWLRKCLLELEGWKVPKSEGGYAGGSLVKRIYRLHKEHGSELTNFEDADPTLIDEAVSQRAKYYLELFNYINMNKEKNSFYQPIYCYPENESGLYMIFDGHHRVSALRSLNFDEVEVIILNNEEII